MSEKKKKHTTRKVGYVTLAIECESDAAERLAAALSETTHSEVTSALKNSLDGSPSTVLQIVQVTISLAATLTPLVAAYIGNKRVKKIKFGAIEIENPTPEQWERLWGDYLSSRPQETSGG